MPLIQPRQPISLHLARDLVRTVKRGHPWVYREALRDLPHAVAGTPAVLLRGKPIASGFYDPACPLALRVCCTDPRITLDDTWAEMRFEVAWDLRQRSFKQATGQLGHNLEPATTGYRLLNGEGDGVPGLVLDRYGEIAVLELDGAGPAGFWDAQGVAQWWADRLRLRGVFYKPRTRGAMGTVLLGDVADTTHEFREYGAKYTVDPRRGQKTGFFLDQRENRAIVRSLANGQRVLNVFGYTGGFSIAAGLGGASHVTTVDIAKPAIDAADMHWRLNDLAPEQHVAVAADAFEFLESAARDKQRWDLVIVDPPSFAPNAAAVPQAEAAYQRLIAASAAVTSPRGWLAAASCSSHITEGDFLTICEEGLSASRRTGRVINVTGQPLDHPWPLALPEYRYLKFVLLRVE